MREILFRGKTKFGDWILGDYSKREQNIYITEHMGDYSHSNKVIPLTVGQYTGFTDWNGVKIFEGDIVHCIGGEFFQGYHETDKNIVVKDITDGVCVCLGEVKFLEIIGNIHDNPELLKGEI